MDMDTVTITDIAMDSMVLSDRNAIPPGNRIIIIMDDMHREMDSMDSTNHDVDIKVIIIAVHRVRTDRDIKDMADINISDVRTRRIVHQWSL